MNKNKKYILIALLASLLFTVTIGFSVWIILSEQASSEHGYIAPKKTPTASVAEVANAQGIYAGKEPSLNVTFQYKSGDRTWDVPYEIDYDTLNVSYTTQPKSETEAGKANITVTLKPKGWAKLLFSEVAVENVSISILPVAYYDTDSTYYPTLDAALAVAATKSEGTFYAILSNYTTESGVAKDAKTIRNPVTIPSGVAFAIPYDANNKFPTKKPDDNTYFAATQSKANAYNSMDSKCTNIVTLSNTMTVEGSLCVYASCISGQGGWFAGNVHGNFGKLTFEGDAAAIAVDSGGQVYAYGFIESHATNHEKFVFSSGSTLRTPFTIYEWRGGTITLAMMGDEDSPVPFLRFTLASIVGAYRIESGANFIAKTSVHMRAPITSTQFASEVPLISSSGSPFLKLPSSGGYIDVSYSADSVDGQYGKNQWDIHGGGGRIAMNAITVKVSEGSMTTAGKYLPVSYLLDIGLYDGEYDLSGQDVKLLPGAVITIGDKATVTANKLIIYSQKPTLGSELSIDTLYPDDTPKVTQLQILNGGKLIVQGGIGGLVPAIAAGGTLEIDKNALVTLTSNEFSSNPSGGPVYESHEKTLLLPKHSNPDEYYNGVGTYYSAAKGSGYAWYSPAITVALDANGGDLSVSSPHTVTTTVPGAGLVLSEFDKTVIPTRAYYTFSHWCKDANCDIENCSRPASIYDGTGVTLYATWIQNKYTIQYYISDNGAIKGGPIAVATSPDSPFTCEHQESLVVTLPTSEEMNYETESSFVRWNSNASNTGTVIVPTTATFADYAAIAKVDAQGTGTITLYAYWASVQCDLTLVVGNGKADIPISGVSPTYNPNLENDTIMGYLDEYNENLAQSMYLEGWYADAECNTPIDFNSGFPYNPDTLEATIYAKWAPKTYVLTITGSSAKDSITDSNATVQSFETQNRYFLESQLTNGFDLTDTLKDLTASISGENDTPGVNTYFAGWSATSVSLTNFADGKASIGANWSEKIAVSYQANGGDINLSTAYYRPNGKDLTLPTPTRTGYTFQGWYTAATGGTKIGDAGASYEPAGSGSLYAQWKQTPYSISISENNATITIQQTTAYYNDTISVTVSFTKSSSRKLTVTDADGNIIFEASRAGDYTFTMPASNVTIAATSSDPVCFVEGTLITLADGTQKPIENLTPNDALLLFNHETGKFEAGYLIMLDHTAEGAQWSNVISLEFSNGEVLQIVNAHGIFDLTLNKYVFIDESNYLDFVGHEFYSSTSDGSSLVGESVTLVNASMTREFIRFYGLLTSWHMNCFANGMLTITPAPHNITTGHTNIFEFGEDLKYDEEKMQADIDKYGLFTYEDLKEYLTEEQFNVLPFKYFKVAIGKGNLTWEDMIYCIKYVMG